MSSYLQQRGFGLAFRIAVPADLRPILGLSEITRTLGTGCKNSAVPNSLEYAAQAKRLFAQLREEIRVGIDEERLLRHAARLKREFRAGRLADEAEAELEEQRGRFHADKRVAELEAKLEGMQAVLEGLKAGTVQIMAPAPIAAPVASPAAAAPIPAAPIPEAMPAPAAPEPKVRKSKTKGAPTLGKVVDLFLSRYPKDKSASMFRKHSGVLPLLVEVIGKNKPVDELKQADITHFFDLIQKLPPRWKDVCNREKIGARELAKRKHELTLGEKTFDDTYLASVRPFMKEARLQWLDQGWPAHITCEGVKFRGDREAGENKQRAFKTAELERLFHGPELQAAAIDAAQEHEFWFPAVGLFTGARVNEICQLNPQTDILQEAETGIWHFHITDEGEAAKGVDKSVKTGSRKVPIHSRLIELGFLDYVERMRKKGAKMLFPQWKPSRGKASGEAEKWFRQLLERLGLRDDSAGAKLVGYHAWRHNLLTTAHNASPRIDATPISGHVGKEDAVVRGYQGELSLTNKRDILEAIPFAIDLKISGR